MYHLLPRPNFAPLHSAFTGFTLMTKRDVEKNLHNNSKRHRFPLPVGWAAAFEPGGEPTSIGCTYVRAFYVRLRLIFLSISPPPWHDATT